MAWSLVLSRFGRDVTPGLRGSCRDRQSVPGIDLDYQIEESCELVWSKDCGCLVDDI